MPPFMFDLICVLIFCVMNSKFCVYLSYAYLLYIFYIILLWLSCLVYSVPFSWSCYCFHQDYTNVGYYTFILSIYFITMKYSFSHQHQPTNVQVCTLLYSNIEIFQYTKFLVFNCTCFYSVYLLNVAKQYFSFTM